MRRLKVVQKSRNHHWWPVALQSYWADDNGDVSWIEPDGTIRKKQFKNRKIARKIHGHTMMRGGGVWETNFEGFFEIDAKIHEIISAIQSFKPPKCRDSCFIVS